MSSDWIDSTLGQFIHFKNGKTSPERNEHTNFPVFGSNGVIGYSDESNAPRNCLIIGRVGSYCGSVYHSINECWVTDNAILGQPKEEGESEFWYFLLLKLDLNSYRSGSGQPLLNQATLKSVPIRVPSNPRVRSEIGKRLMKFNEKIELNRQTNQTLEQIAQALFKSWFVDFDPVKAKVMVLENGGTQSEAELAAMEVISGKTVQELEAMQTQHPDQYQQLQQTTSLFPNAMQDSELGEIPAGWEVKPFGDMLSKTIGGDWGKEEPDDKHTEMVRILRGTDLPKVFLGDDSGVPTRYVEAKKLKTRLLEDGDIIIEVSGGSKDQPTGRSLFLTQSLMDRLNSRLEPASFCRLFRPITKEVGYLLAVHLMKIYADGKTWHYQVQSTGISNFQTKVFLEKEIIVVPNHGVLERFSRLVKPIFQKIHSSESNSLKELRDTLLPKLLSGELQILTEDAA